MCPTLNVKCECELEGWEKVDCKQPIIKLKIRFKKCKIMIFCPCEVMCLAWDQAPQWGGKAKMSTCK